MAASKKLRLGVNIDHVATIRNARGGKHPDPVKAAEQAALAGADGITAHLREDRRHIGDADIERLAQEIGLPLNLEMAATDEMLEIALRHKPNACCIVPEKRQEVTTEGGLDVVGGRAALAEIIQPIKDAGIRVSLFIDADTAQIETSAALGADIIELHTGTYCHAHHDGNEAAFAAELEKLKAGAVLANNLGLEVHAGHGLCFETVSPIAAMPEVVELNIGHFLIGEAIFTGLEGAIGEMRRLMLEARRGISV